MAGVVNALPGVGSAISAVSGIANAIMNKKENDRNRKWQTSEREASQKWQEEQTARNIQHQKDLYQWQQEMYTSPAAQLSLLKEAGLNPDLAYGNAVSGSSMPSVTSPTSATATSPNTYSYDSAFRTISSSALSAAEISKLNSEADLNKEKSKTENSIRLLNGSYVELTNAQRDWTFEDKKRISSQISNLDMDTLKAKEEIDLVIQNRKFMEASTDEKKQVVYEMMNTFSTRFDTLKWKERRAFTELGISEQDLSYLKQSLSNRLELLSQNVEAAKNQNVLSYWDVVDANYQHTKVYKDAKGNSLGTGARILYDTMVAMATGQSAMLETQLDLLQTYGDAHAVISLASQFISALGSAAASVMAARYMSTKNTILNGSQKMGTIGFNNGRH